MDEQAGTAAPTTAPPPTSLHALREQLDTLRRECLSTIRTRHMRALPAFVSRADLDWLNRELIGMQALNRTIRPWHRIGGAERWGNPPIRTTVLLTAADLIPYLSDALQVLAALGTWHLGDQNPDGGALERDDA